MVLSETLVGLSFFDEHISCTEINNMVQALNNRGEEEFPKRISITAANISITTITSLITQNTKQIFTALNINKNVLLKPPQNWKEDDHYIFGLNRVNKLAVTNDHAERGIAFMTSFNNCLTNNEEQRKYLLQVVEMLRIMISGYISGL